MFYLDFTIIMIIAMNLFKPFIIMNQFNATINIYYLMNYFN